MISTRAPTAYTRGVAGNVSGVRRAQVPARSADQLADALAEALAPREGELILVFVDSALDPDLVAPALARALAPATVVGCTSSGEIAGPVTSGTAVGIALGPPNLRFAVELAA